MSRLNTEQGIALPLTVFIVALLTVTLAAAFARVGAEGAIATGSADAVTALAVSQSGLQTYFGSKTSRPPNGDSVRVNVSGGYADVVARIVRHPPDTMIDEMYIVRSTGYAIQPTAGAQPQGRRTVAQFAVWQTGSIDAVAAYQAANRLQQRGGPATITINGTDGSGIAPAIFGLRTQNASATITGTITGSPVGQDATGNGDDVAALADIDWPLTTSGGFVPDYPYLKASDPSYPSQMVYGDTTVSDVAGYGLLIVQGDLTLSGSWLIWHGIIIVGGKIDFDAQSIWIYGLAKSGMGKPPGGNPRPQGQLGGANRQLTISYNSYDVGQTLRSLTGFVPIGNARVDNWATY